MTRGLAPPKHPSMSLRTVLALLCAGTRAHSRPRLGLRRGRGRQDGDHPSDELARRRSNPPPSRPPPPGELLLAFITSDGPSTGGTQSFSNVTGGGVTWRLRRRANTQAGTAEIWAANAPTVLTNASVTATRANGSYVGSITVVTFTGADQARRRGDRGGRRGDRRSLGLADHHPRRCLGLGRRQRLGQSGRAHRRRQTRPRSTSSWPRSATRCGCSARTRRRQFAATPVTLNDTAPTTDRWNLAAVEVLPAVVDTQPPSAPAKLAAGTVTSTQVPLSWTASTDDQGVAGYRVFRGATQVGEVERHELHRHHRRGEHDLHLHGQGLRRRRERLRSIRTGDRDDAAPGDTTPPTVSMTAPEGGATVSGSSVSLAATASDASGIAGVQFLLDGSPLGAEDTTSPYGLTWDSTTVANGSHTLAARARDGSGNAATSAPVTVKVENGGGRPGPGRPVGAADPAARGRDPLGPSADDGQDPALPGRLLDRRPAVRPRPSDRHRRPTCPTPKRTSSAPARRFSPTAVCWWSAAPRPAGASASTTSPPSTGIRNPGANWRR